MGFLAAECRQPAGCGNSMTISTFSQTSTNGYYRAKYGFDETGVLDLILPLDKARRTLDSGCFRRNPEPGEFVIPDVALPGSNDRLRAILEQSRIAVHYNRYDDTALMHIGPDNSLILTNVAGWGPPYTEPYSYAELDDSYVCYWETSPATWGPELPPWADPDEYEDCSVWYRGS